MKRMLCLLIAIVLCLPLNACARPQSVPPKKAMLILQSWSSSFAEDVTRGANEAAGQFGFEITVKNVSAQDAAKQQADLIRTATNQGFGAIIVDPADSATVGMAAGEARDHHIPVVSVCSGMQAYQSCIVDTDMDQTAAGVFLLAQGLVGNKASVLVLNCLDEYDNTQRLADALQAKQKEFPDMNLKKIDFRIGDNTEMLNSWNEYLISGRDNIAVIALNTYATVFASNQLKTPPGGRKTAIISFSHDKNVISMLEQKHVDAICINRNVNLGFTAVEQANKAIEGKTVQNVLIPSVFVNMQNLYSSEIQEILFPLS